MALLEAYFVVEETTDQGLKIFPRVTQLESRPKIQTQVILTPKSIFLLASQSWVLSEFGGFALKIWHLRMLLLRQLTLAQLFSLGEWSETSGGTDDGTADWYRGFAEEPNGSEAGGHSGRSVSTNWAGDHTLSPAHAEALTRISICIMLRSRVVVMEALWDHYPLEHVPQRIILECSRDERGQITITLSLSFHIYLVARKTVWFPRAVGSVQIMHRKVVCKQSRLSVMQGAFTMY